MTNETVRDNCCWIDLPLITDERGSLSFVESGQQVAFPIRRFFYLYHLAKGATRGKHAHRATQQLFIAINGSLRLVVDDGSDKKEWLLNTPHRALLVPPLHWVELNHFSDGAVCLVATDKNYDEADYLRDYDAFIMLARQ
ncbi:MAG: FdtA/QdtA family cupin domain-containing protein [Alphaproteobacteria bacterium]|nr:FdtA/QdtA family cupin domain-containing protein [Alphaproteobacteria bacterium]